MKKVKLSDQIRILFVSCLTLVFILSFNGCEPQQQRMDQPKTDADFHKEQIISFRKNVQPLEAILQKHQVKEVLFSGTMTIQSAAIPVYIAPVRVAEKPDVEKFFQGPTPYAVLYASSDITLLENNVSLKKGSYMLAFEEAETSWNTKLIDAAGRTAAVLTTSNFSGINASIDDEFDRLRRRAREEAERRGFDLLIVDIEIEFGPGTEFFVSFLWWKWSLFEDPPLPY